MVLHFMMEPSLE